MGGKALKIGIVAISLGLLIASSSACGQNSSQAAALNNLDRVVPRLPSGLSIEEVEDRLGEPNAQFEVTIGAPETVLTYGLWQVVFRPSLYKRTRRYPAGERGDQPVAPLDRKIRAVPRTSGAVDNAAVLQDEVVGRLLGAANKTDGGATENDDERGES